MKAIIWGSTGSLPAPLTSRALREKLIGAIAASQGRRFTGRDSIELFVREELSFTLSGSYNGNTSCVELREGGEHVLLDAGSGIRDFGHYAFHNIPVPARFHVFLSHLHWDHLQGFPFFLPAFSPGNRIDFYGGHEALEQAITAQQNPPYFPVSFGYMQAQKYFHILQPQEEYALAGYRVCMLEQDHPGLSYGYSFERDGKKVVYSTDSEHRGADNRSFEGLMDFARNADLLIFDAQYSLLEAIGDKASWGHSSNVIGVEIAVRARVKHLCLFHSEHTHSDEMLEKILQGARQFSSLQPGGFMPQVSMAYDGLELDI